MRPNPFADNPHMQTIRDLAETMETEIVEPKSGCNHCYGRGYTAIDTADDSPIICKCVIGKKTDTKLTEAQDRVLFNRDKRRQMRPKKKRSRHKKLDAKTNESEFDADFLAAVDAESGSGAIPEPDAETSDDVKYTAPNEFTGH